MSNYCELVLYVGRCLADGLAPGTFHPESSDPHSLKRIADALTVIDRYLRASQRWGLIIDYKNLLKDNGEADSLVSFALGHFKDAREVIEPHQCIHGRIIFARKIRFEDCSERDGEGIIRVMRESGHVPNEMEAKADWIRKVYSSADLILIKLRELDARADEFWRSSLNFY